jgi:hypothetical protein
MHCPTRALSKSTQKEGIMSKWHTLPLTTPNARDEKQRSEIVHLHIIVRAIRAVDLFSALLAGQTCRSDVTRNARQSLSHNSEF